MKLTGAQAIAQALKMHGIHYVTGVLRRDCLSLLHALLDMGRSIPFIRVMQSISAVRPADGIHRTCDRSMAVVSGIGGNDLANASGVSSTAEHSGASLSLCAYVAAGKYFPKEFTLRDASNAQIGPSAFGSAPKGWNLRNARDLPGVLPLAFGDLLPNQASPMQPDVQPEVQGKEIDIDVSPIQSVGMLDLADAAGRFIEQAKALLDASARTALFVGVGAREVLLSKRVKFRAID